jgi:hypothetical protein
MKNYIIQHGTLEYKEILDLVFPINKKYADKFEFEYISDCSNLLTDDKKEWEKLTFIKNFLETVEDGSLVVWEDSDSLNIGNEDLKNIIKNEDQIGMVNIYHGLNGMEPISNYWNAGVIAIRNSSNIRNIINDWLNSGEKTDEDAFSKSAKLDEIKIASINPKWNVWKNTEHLVKNPQIVAFHGINVTLKAKVVKEYIKNNNL